MFETHSAVSWYGHGYWLRRWLGWPNWLPLPIASDHGLSFSGQLEPHESNSLSKIFLTWNRYRYHWIRHISHKNVFLIPHPYIGILSSLVIPAPLDRRGTIFFWPHTTEDQVISDGYIPVLLADIQQLEQRYQPVTICLHYHDEKNPRLKAELEGVNVVTAGSPYSSTFAERLINLMARHKYSSAPMIGSYVPISEMLGVPFFLHGTKAIYKTIGRHAEIETGLVDPLAQWLEQILESEFSNPPDHPSPARYGLMSDLLGLESDVSREKLKLLMVLELLRLSFTTLFLLRWIKYLLGKHI